MYLSELSYAGFRNLHSARIEPATGLNILTGENGAGKSGLLEAVHLVATGKSFRSSRNSAAINWDTNALRVSGTWQPFNANERSWRVEIAVRGNETSLSAAGRSLTRVDLLSRFPVVFVGAESLRFFEDGPAFRRRQLDWGAFHVEHRYLHEWRIYRQALSQRNALLRSMRPESARNRSEFSGWENQMAQSAAALTRLRRRFFTLLDATFEATKPVMGVSPATTLAYRSGWDIEAGLAMELEVSRDKDCRLGYTSVGPHRDDILLHHGGRSALSGLSRGQQKAVMLCFFLAMDEVIASLGEVPPLLLIDDLGAELDAEHQSKILAIAASRPQALVAAVNIPSAVVLPEHTRFHVEQGKISK